MSRYGSAEGLQRFCGRAQTYGNQSGVYDSAKPCYVTLTFETKIHRLEWFCPGYPHQRHPNAPKFEDRSPEETEWQERCAREAAWKLAKSILKLRSTRTAWTSSKKNVLTIIGMLIWTEVCQTHGKVLQKLHYERETCQRIFTWFGERLTNVQTTSRHDHVWPEVWSKIGKVAQNRENKNGQLTKPQIGQCSTERKIFHWTNWWRISGNNEECKEKAGNTMTPAMPCKFKSRESFLATRAWSECIFTGHKIEKWLHSRGLKLSQQKHHEDHIASHGYTSMSHYNLVHKCIPIPQAICARFNNNIWSIGWRSAAFSAWSNQNS